jgi:plastocyanin domain-containing protein
LNLRRELPLQQPVEITVTPASGTLAFTCGMDMYRGAVVAQ